MCCALGGNQCAGSASCRAMLRSQNAANALPRQFRTLSRINPAAVTWAANSGDTPHGPSTSSGTTNIASWAKHHCQRLTRALSPWLQTVIRQTSWEVVLFAYETRSLLYKCRKRRPTSTAHIAAARFCTRIDRGESVPASSSVQVSLRRRELQRRRHHPCQRLRCWMHSVIAKPQQQPW